MQVLVRTNMNNIQFCMILGYFFAGTNLNWGKNHVLWISAGRGCLLFSDNLNTNTLRVSALTIYWF